MSCVMCTSLMDNMRAYPQLARYCFSLFPHRRKVTIATNDDLSRNSKNTIDTRTEHISNQTKSININGQLTILDKDNINEKVNVLQDDDPLKTVASEQIQDSKIPNEENDNEENGVLENKNPNHKEMEESDNSDADGNEDGMLTICEENNDDISLSSENSEGGEDIDDIKRVVHIKEEVDESNEKVCNVIIEEFIPKEEKLENNEVDPLDGSDQEAVKDVEWKREEDKIILEVLQKQLSPEERMEKSIVETIEEKNIPQSIAKLLTEKSLFDVRDRIYYLLQMLVLK